MRFRLSSGLSLRYRTCGAGLPVLLLHPVGLRLEFWNRVVAAVDGRFRAIVPDLRGHGESDAPNGPFSLEDLAGDVIELSRALAGERAVVVGCSMGGMVAQAMALAAPELLAGLVVANAGNTRTRESRAAMEQRALAVMGGMPRVLEATLARWFSASVRINKPELVLAAKEWLLEADPIVHAWAWHAIRDLDFGARLSAVRTPTLAIAASEDQSTAPSALQALAQAVPGAQYREMSGIGHLAPLEEPEGFARLLLEFCSSIHASSD